MFVKGIRIRRCEHVEPGKAYVMAAPRKVEQEAYQIDVLVYGEDEAYQRLMAKLLLRGVLIHNIAEWEPVSEKENE